MSDPISEVRPEMTVLIVGAYGLIGSDVARRLARDGHTIIGMGRDVDTGNRVLPTINWLSADLRSMTDVGAWQSYLKGVDAVVNCSGALQD